MPADIDIARRSEFERLADLVYEPLQRYLRRRVAASDVPDLFDDVLLVLWRRLEDVPTDDPLPWAYGVARNTIANHRRGERRRLHLVRRVESHHADRRPPQPAPTSAAEAALWQALDQIGEADRELVRLWAWEQLDPREIAVVLGTTPNAVSLRLSRLRARLRSEIERQNDGDAGHEARGHRREDEP